MSKRSRLPWLIIGGIILLVIILAALFLSSPSPQPVTIPSPAIISSTDFMAPTSPQPPSCTVAINGQKVLPSSILLQVMANTCIPGDITELRVSVTGCVYDPCFWIGNTKKLKKSGELSYTLRYSISTIVQEVPAAAASRLSAVTSGASQRIEAATNSAS